MEEVSTTLAFLERGGLLAVLLLVLAALFTGHLVLGWVYTAMRRERDFWRDLALRAMTGTEKAIGLIERVNS